MECVALCICTECLAAGTPLRILRRVADSRMLLLGLGGRHALPAFHQSPREVATLSELFALPCEACLFVFPRDRDWLAAAIADVAELVRPTGAWFTFLIKRMPAPDCRRIDEDVKSFLAAPAVAQAVCLPSGPSFASVARLFSEQPICTTVEAVQLPRRSALPIAPPTTAPPLHWVIPHKGALAELAACLWYVRHLEGPKGRVQVYFDEELTAEHAALMQRFNEVRYAAISPPGLGPYVARQHLAESVEDDAVIVFQDSDDVPVASRLPSLLAHMAASGAELVGSHELRLDMMAKKVVAVRYPLDVNGALRYWTSHSQLHPTTLVTRAALRRAGGFSTVRRFGADSQFLLRAYFSLKIENVDEFLYIRRIRPDSLTMAPDTALGSPERLRLLHAWSQDFGDVKLGRLTLAASSLSPSHTAVPYRIQALPHES